MSHHSVSQHLDKKLSLAKSVSHIQIFLRVQAGQEGQSLPVALGGQVGLTDLTVQAAPLDLLALSALDPLLSLSGKNTLVLEIQTLIQVA